MSQYITLKKTDKRFDQYLLGTFSQSERAIAVKTLNVNTDTEEVTFEILAKQKIKKPGRLRVCLQLFKIYNFVYVLFPLLLVVVKNYADHSKSDLLSALLAAIGICFGFIAANARNEYLDHIKGFDRIDSEAGTRVIQRGWLTAAQVRGVSYLFLTLSLLCAAPLVVVQPYLVFIILVALLIALMAQFVGGTSFKYQIGGELSLFLLFGPLLALGYQVVLGASWDLEVILLGALWGWLLLFIVHLKNFSQLITLSQGKFQNTITWLGFDRARGFIAFWWFTFIAFFFVYHMEFAGMYWGWYLTLMLLFFSIRFWVRIKSVKSSVGSDIKKLNKIGRRLFFLVVFVWTLESLWYVVKWNPY